MIYAILGFSVAIAAIFSVTVAETLVGKAIFENHRAHIAITLAVIGVTFWFVGRYLGRQRNLKAQFETGSDPGKHFLLFDLRYWGPMLVALSGITLFICPLRTTQQIVAQAPPPPPVQQPIAVEEPMPLPPPPEPKAPVVFPALKMQGIIFRKIRPCAIINGHSYTTGDRLGNV